MSFTFHAFELATLLRVRRHFSDVKGPLVNGFILSMLRHPAFRGFGRGFDNPAFWLCLSIRVSVWSLQTPHDLDITFAVRETLSYVCEFE